MQYNTKLNIYFLVKIASFFKVSRFWNGLIQIFLSTNICENRISYLSLSVFDADLCRPCILLAHRPPEPHRAVAEHLPRAGLVQALPSVGAHGLGRDCLAGGGLLLAVPAAEAARALARAVAGAGAAVAAVALDGLGAGGAAEARGAEAEAVGVVGAPDGCADAAVGAGGAGDAGGGVAVNRGPVVA